LSSYYTWSTSCCLWKLERAKHSTKGNKEYDRQQFGTDSDWSESFEKQQVEIGLVSMLAVFQRKIGLVSGFSMGKLRT
jgi:hypothetical protein